MRKSWFERIKDMRTPKGSSSKAEQGVFQRDVKGSKESGKAWNTNNPVLDPSSATQPGNETPQDAPPAYTATAAEDEYPFLSIFDTVFVIDDSSSMAGPSWGEVRNVLLAITPICTSHDADGIDIYFLNHKSGACGSRTKPSGGYYNISNTDEVQRIFESVRPSGATPTGNRLQSILRPYMTNLNDHEDEIDSIKPVNIILMTDGAPTDDPESVIVHHARWLNQLKAPPYQVGIQIFQANNIVEATKYLEELDDNLEKSGIRDMVDTVTWDILCSKGIKSLSAGAVLKVVLGAVNRQLDREKLKPNQAHII